MEILEKKIQPNTAVINHCHEDPDVRAVCKYLK